MSLLLTLKSQSLFDVKSTISYGYPSVYPGMIQRCSRKQPSWVDQPWLDPFLVQCRSRLRLDLISTLQQRYRHVSSTDCIRNKKILNSQVGKRRVMCLKDMTILQNTLKPGKLSNH